MTTQDYATTAIEKSADDLIKAALALPEDKRDWKPLDKGRSALNQLAECVVTNEMSARIVEAAAWSEEIMAQYGEQVAALDTFDKAAAGLRESTAHLAAAVRGAADTSLGAEIRLPWATVTLAELFLMPLWNMSYHQGQITYIETLM